MEPHSASPAAACKILGQCQPVAGAQRAVRGRVGTALRGGQQTHIAVRRAQWCPHLSGFSCSTETHLYCCDLLVHPFHGENGPRFMHTLLLALGLTNHANAALKHLCAGLLADAHMKAFLLGAYTWDCPGGIAGPRSGAKPAAAQHFSRAPPPAAHEHVGRPPASSALATVHSFIFSHSDDFAVVLLYCYFFNIGR